MKKIIIYSVLLVTALVGCRKSDNPKLPTFIRVPLPLITADATADTKLLSSDPEAFSGKYTVDIFYKDDVPPKKFDIVVRKNGDNSTAKVIQTDITTFPTSFTITGTQLKDLFGATPVGGDAFDIGVDVTAQDGVKYYAFPDGAIGYGPNVSQIPGASLTIRYSVFCDFDVDAFVGDGNFTVLTDEWGDYGEGADVTLTKIDATHVSFEFKPADPKPIIVRVDLTTNQTFVDKQVYGDAAGYGVPQYGLISCETNNDKNNDFVSPCAQTLSVNLGHTVAAGSFGSAVFKIQKK